MSDQDDTETGTDPKELTPETDDDGTVDHLAYMMQRGRNREAAAIVSDLSTIIPKVHPDHRGPLRELKAAWEQRRQTTLAHVEELEADTPTTFTRLYEILALHRHRPTDPCRCEDCDCPLHTYPLGPDTCLWCREGHHHNPGGLLG